MADEARDPALSEAARVWGIIPDYESQEHSPVRTSDDAILAALRELGAPVEGRADLPGAVRARQSEHWALLVEPVVVSWDGGGRRGAAQGAGAAATVEVRLLAGEAAGTLRCELTREDGRTEEWPVRADELQEVRAFEVGGRAYVSGRLRLPADLGQGYHDLTIHSGPRHATARVIRAPVRAWTPEDKGAPPRAWGSFLPLYALRTARSHGIADLTDLRALQSWTAGHGGSVVGTLPLLPAFLDRPFDPSPYSPVSRLFWNELYLDPERLPGLERAPETRALLASADYRADSERLRGQPEVDHRAVYAHRRRVLDQIARELAPADAPLPAELAEYVGRCSAAREYAAFRAIGEREGRTWYEWPGHLRAGSVGPDDVDEIPYRRHLYAQWAMDQQLLEQGRGASGSQASLYMDLPLGAHPDGFDVWRWRDLFANASAGAPPDAFFAGGQDWGFPPIHPRRARATGHAYWAASLRHLMRVSSMLRLDHVMGLHRLFWIPRGISAVHGVYVRYPEEELFAVMCLESHRHRTEVVGEDLGTVAVEMRRAMDEHRLRRMYVVPFELDAAKGVLAPQPENSVASLNTHDMPPFASWVEEGDNADVLGRALGTTARAPAELLRPALTRLAEGSARLLLVSLEDLWLETESQNRPGTAPTENWRRKSRYTLEEIDGIDGVAETLKAVDRARRMAPRGPAVRPTTKRQKATS